MIGDNSSQQGENSKKTMEVAQEETKRASVELTVLMKDGVTQFYKKVRDIEPSSVSRFRDINLTMQNFTFEVQVPAVARIDTIPRNKYTGAQRVQKRTLRVLDDINLQFKSGTISLILGPPGSGRSSLLKALAGSLSKEGCSGEVLFNGLAVEKVDKLRTVALVDQTDNHTPVLTVRETLQFASECQVGKTISGDSSSDEYEHISERNVDVILRLLGLEGCADTIVGNAAIRGISGGQRRRVTSAEVLVSGVPVLLGDEISTGLDSSATFDIVSALKSWAATMKGTVVLALLQPQPEVVALFDQLVCLDQGKVMCVGTAQEVETYFEGIGFHCPPRKDFADFLQEVTSPAGQKYFRPNNSFAAAPRTVQEFAELYKKSKLYCDLTSCIERTILETPECPLRSADAVRIMKNGEHHFANSFSRSLTLLLKREWALAMRDKHMLRSLFGEALVVGLLMGAIFFGLAGVQYYTVPRSGVGALFFCCAILQRQAWQQIPILMRARPTFYKQRRRDFFPTAAFIFAFTIAQIPLNVCAMSIFCPIVYFMIGYTVSPGNFFFFFLTMITLQHALRALFLSIAAAARTASSAQFSCSLLVVCFLLFSGYILPNNLIPEYWIWVYWLNPLAFALRSLMINEYTSSKYSESQTAYVTSAYGIEDQLSLGFMWAGPIILTVYFFLFTGLSIVLLQHIRFDGIKPKAVVTIPESHAQLPSSMASASSATSPNASPIASMSESVELDLETGNTEGDDKCWQVQGHDFIPVTLAFQHVHYTVFPKGAGKEGVQLLNDVSGIFRPGTMTALMGSSGAGKTTLMDVIAGRKTSGQVEGVIAINGMPARPSDFSRISGYCEQMDVHSPEATVREAFLFSAALRQDQQILMEEKAKFVDYIITLLELENVKDRLIGESTTDGLSVEQRKRVTIGVELSANPSVLFADEPTSGLDARAAMVVMRALRRVAQANRTVVATIHQPSANIFEMFDGLLLLQRGGKTIFNGQLGTESNKLIDYFAKNGAPSINPGENPANYMLRVIGAGIVRGGGKKADTVNPADESVNAKDDAEHCSSDFHQVYVNSDLNDSTLREVGYELERGVHRSSSTTNVLRSGRATSPLFQFSQCAKKAFTTYYRSPQYNLKRMVTLVLLGVLFGTAFLYSGEVFPITTSPQARAFAALIYLCMDFIGILFFTAVLPITFRERTVYYRERAAQMYSPGVYMAAIFVVELPYLIASVGMFTVITYFLVGLHPDWFGYFFLVFWLYVSLCTYIGQLFAIMAPHEVVGQVLIGFTTVVFNLSSGYLVSQPNMPAAISWIFYVAPSSYAFNGLASTQLGYCPEPGNLEYMGCNFLTDVNETLAEYAEKTFALHADEIYNVDIPALFAFWITTLVLCGFSLKYINHDTK